MPKKVHSLIQKVTACISFFRRFCTFTTTPVLIKQALCGIVAFIAATSVPCFPSGCVKNMCLYAGLPAGVSGVRRDMNDNVAFKHKHSVYNF